MPFKITNNGPSLETRRKQNKAKRERLDQHDREYRPLDGKAWFSDEEKARSLQKKAELAEKQRERMAALENLKLKKPALYRQIMKKLKKQKGM